MPSAIAAPIAIARPSRYFLETPRWSTSSAIGPVGGIELTKAIAKPDTTARSSIGDIASGLLHALADQTFLRGRRDEPAVAREDAPAHEPARAVRGGAVDRV